MSSLPSLSVAFFLVCTFLTSRTALASRNTRVDGYTIGKATFDSGGKIVFKKDLTWKYSPASGESLDMQVNGRDEWSVYMTDVSGRNWQLDYHTKELLRDHEPIETVTSGEIGKINGRNVGEVKYTDAGGTERRFYRFNDKVWAWENGDISKMNNGHRTDEWSVYLTCGDETKTQIQIDLHTQKIYATVSGGAREEFARFNRGKDVDYNRIAYWNE